MLVYDPKKKNFWSMYDPGLHLYLDFSPSTVSVRNHKSFLVLLPFGFHQQHMGGKELHTHHIACSVCSVAFPDWNWNCNWRQSLVPNATDLLLQPWTNTSRNDPGFFTQKNHPDRLQQHENSNASALKCSSESCQVFLNPLKTFTAVNQMMMMMEEGMIECIDSKQPETSVFGRVGHFVLQILLQCLCR